MGGQDGETVVVLGLEHGGLSGLGAATLNGQKVGEELARDVVRWT
jgi:hypothetical protein